MRSEFKSGPEQGQGVGFTLRYLGRQWEEFNLGEGEDDTILCICFKKTTYLL